MQKKTKLVILSDYGLDDAVALIYLLENRQSFSSIDVVAIAGNTSKENSLNNAKKLLANYLGDKTGVRLIESLNEQQFFAHLPSIHGNDGMGDLLSEKPLDVPLLNYADWFKTLGAEPFVLFSVGPCTLTAQILKAYSPVKLVLMAGMVDAEPNYEGMEFNQALDVTTYNFCIKQANAVATLDTCRTAEFNLAFKRRTDETLLSRLINRAEELAEKRHPDNCYIYDYIAAQYLIRPEAFETIKCLDKWGNTLFQLRVKVGFVW